MSRSIAGLSALADDYDVLLSDVWGVIHNGLESFPAACEALARWRETRGPVILISNSPRPAAEVIAQLAELNVPTRAWSAVVTSGDATRGLLAARAPGPAFRIGPDRDDPLFDGLGLAFGDLESAAFIACTGPNDDEVETPEHYRAALTRGVARGLEMICANPDKVVQRGDRLIYCGGALADLYERLGGMAIMAGKPFGPIYERSLARAESLLGRPVARNRVLAIGDGIATDMTGAQAQDLDRLFIATGIHAEETRGPDGALSTEALDVLLAESGLTAQYGMTDLSW